MLFKEIDIKYIGIILLILGTFFYISSIEKPHKRHLNKPLDEIPLSIGGFQGEIVTFNHKTLKNAGVDSYIMRSYHHDNTIIGVYVGYYNSQKVGHTIHSPLHCYPGSGWEPVFEEKKSIPIPIASTGEIPVKKLIIQKGYEKQLVYYWYQSRGRHINDEYWAKVFLIRDTIIKKRNDGSLVRISSRIVDSEETTEEELQVFINKFYPYLEECIPQ